MDNNRSWMYPRVDSSGLLNHAFVVGLEEFMNHVISQPSSLNGTNIKCPCTKCKFKRHWDAKIVKLHLLKKGFVENYYVWNRQSSTSYSNISRGGDEDNLMYDMVMDAAGPNFDPRSEEIPNAEAQKLYDILHSSERELYGGCKTSQLSAMARMLSLKSDHHWSEACYDQTSEFIKSILPEDNTFIDGFYNTKKHMEGLGLPSEKIKSLRAERSRPADGSSTPQSVDENQLFYDAVGGRNSKNRIYGLGSSQDLFYAPSSSTIAHFSNSSHPNSQDYEKLQTELEVMKERMKEMDAMQQRMKDMENLLARMADNQNQ
ncbi:hypothetical protein POM88_015238 [Heracleum sosnowskyi]|uniref:Transposase-associated domain-containing protein n=1 Tax=Heracleum sosnowskyi TaxID=360622 RepID=A0AAD8MRU8_9APIA|nr:hypothetical protein POM88_015238 [Heracleum sosnowskyi]